MFFFNYLFHKSYKISLSLGNEGFYPEINAWCLATLLPWLNYFSILKILRNSSIIGNDLYKNLLIASVIYWILSYLYVIVSGYYLKIISSNDLLKERRVMGEYFICSLYDCYIFIVLLLFG
jgi:hypothetical protein